MVDDDKIQELLFSPGGDGWKNQSIVVLLEKRLGDSHQLYLDYINGIERVIGNINQELSIYSRPVQEQINRPVTRYRLERYSGSS